MRTEYIFDADTAALLYTTEYSGASIVRRTFVQDWLYKDRVPIFVTEGEDARREMFNHFGDDSSWPEGWWSRLVAPMATKASVTRATIDWPPFFEKMPPVGPKY